MIQYGTPHDYRKELIIVLIVPLRCALLIGAH